MRKHEAVPITGASGGLGAEFAKQLAEKKYNLIPAARNEGKLYALKNELETKYGVSVHVCAADLSVPDAALDVYNDMREHELSADVLINNAGGGDSGSFADSDWVKQYRMVQVNITALLH